MRPFGAVQVKRNRRISILGSCNRTVKNELLLTDKIISELAVQYGVVPVYTIDRNIPNKVMPARNSPTNVTGATNSTMTMEHIVVLRKE
jgi:hypothetical protein